MNQKLTRGRLPHQAIRYLNETTETDAEQIKKDFYELFGRNVSDNAIRKHCHNVVQRDESPTLFMSTFQDVMDKRYITDDKTEVEVGELFIHFKEPSGQLTAVSLGLFNPEHIEKISNARINVLKREIEHLKARLNVVS